MHWQQIGIDNFQNLFNISLPSGDTLIHYLTEVKSEQIPILLYYCKVKNFGLRIVPNLKGITPLHICVKESHTLLATKLLNHLASMALEDHSRFI